MSETIRIRALSTFVEFDGRQMCVFNKGDEGPLRADIAARKIEDGYAEQVLPVELDGSGEHLPPVDDAAKTAPSRDPLDHDGDGEAGGSIAATGDNIAALRTLYQEVVGKKPFPGWDAVELQRRIDEADQAPA